MSWISSEAVSVLRFLLPGFAAAAIFYSLTSHPKPSEFGRIILALTFTLIAQAIVLLISSIAPMDDAWIKKWELVVSVPIAILLALIASYISINDTMHGILRRLGVTRETSYPSEWYSAFSRHSDCYVVLHLKGERRLYGWPEEWPSRSDQGHFRIVQGEWLFENKPETLAEDEPKTSTIVSAILIPVDEVEMVEFIPYKESEGESYGQGTSTTAKDTHQKG